MEQAVEHARPPENAGCRLGPRSASHFLDPMALRGHEAIGAGHDGDHFSGVWLCGASCPRRSAALGESQNSGREDRRRLLRPGERGRGGERENGRESGGGMLSKFSRLSVSLQRPAVRCLSVSLSLCASVSWVASG